MKKILLHTVFIILTFFVVISINAEEIQTFHSNITINKDGTIDVQENIDYDFSYLSKHGIYRTIPTIKINQDGKKFLMDLQIMSVVDEEGNWYKYQLIGTDDRREIKIGDPDKTITGVHRYVISYKVSGALSYFSDHDELYWNVTGNEWPVPIASATAAVILPQEIKKEDVKTTCYTGSFGSTTSDCSELNSNRILSANEGLTIVVHFPKNIVAVLEPKEFVAFEDTLVGKLVLGLIALIGLIWYIFLPIYIIYRWFKYGRDPKSTVGITTAWFDPPKTQDLKRFLTPGEVGTLGDETVDMKDISATIVDLARRGYLIIDEKKRGDFYLIKNKNPDNKLLLFEIELLNGFFGNKKEIRIKDEDLYQVIEDIKSGLYNQVVVDGLFPANPDSIRKLYYIGAFIAVVTGNIFLAIVAFIFGKNMPRKTVFGVEVKNVAFSLKNFLTSQKRQLEFQADKQLMFERLLPYAIAFGVEKIWAKRFKTLNIIQPSWYHSYSSTNFNSYLLISSLNSSFRSISSAATPTRSSSGFSSGSSGGFSGGGGGGGGGGSW